MTFIQLLAMELLYDSCNLSGVAMHLNQGKFRQNGGCGYILPPKFMRDPDEKGIATACLVTSYQLSLMLQISLHI